MVFGIYVYSPKGSLLSTRSIRINAWQTTGNFLSFISALRAAALYGNISIKVIYQNVMMDLYRPPSLAEKKGKMLWIIMVPMYW